MTEISKEEVESTIERALKTRSAGRRSVDYNRQKGWWVLVIGALFQGGFLLMSWRLMTMGERQLDRERAMLVQQHVEIVAAIKDQAQATRELTAELRKGR